MIVLHQKINDYGTGIPQHEMEAFARSILPEIRAYFESPEGKAKYEKWKAEQETRKSEDT